MRNIILLLLTALLFTNCSSSSDKFEGEWECVDSEFNGSSKIIRIKKLENNVYELKWGNTTATTEPHINNETIKYYNYIFSINNAGKLVISNRFSGCSAYKKK